MKVKVTYSEIWRISWPIMLSSLAGTVINFTDVAFVARIGEKELAASALGGVFYFLLLMLGTAVGIGAQIIISRKAGEDRPTEIGHVFDHSLVILLVFSMLMLLFLYLAIPSLLPLIINDGEVAAAALSYLKARSWSLPLMMMLIALRAFYTGITQTRIITYSTVLMMVLNVILNYGFVFGGMGFPALGLIGAGLASAISESLAVVYAVIYTMSRSVFQKFRLFKFTQLKRTAYVQILTLSSPIMLQHFLSMGAWFLFFVLIEKLGARELAVSNVLRSIYMVLMTPIWGFSQASNSMVSNLLGQNKEHEVIPLVTKIVKMSFLIGAGGILTSIVFKDLLFRLTTSDVMLIQEAIPGFYVVCVATIVFSITMVLISAISGTGRTTAAMIIEVISLVIYVAYILVFTVILPGTLELVWTSELIYWLIMGIISYFYLVSGKWKSKLITEKL